MIQGGRSGVGRYVIALAEAMASRDVEMHIAGLEVDRAHFPLVPDSHWVSIPRAASSGVANLLWHQMYLPSIVRRQKYDVVHIPSYRRMLVNCSAPQVATIHDCAPFIMADKYDALRGFYGRKVIPWIARRMDHVIAVSATTGEDIERYLKVMPERMHVIPNGINHQRFHPPVTGSMNSFRQKHSLYKPYLIYIARFEHPAKNHVRLIEAFGKFRDESRLDWQLVLGGAPWHGKEVIDDALKQSAHGSAIRMVGFVDDDELPLWYSCAEALVFPSLMEGFGFPVIESQACGTITVASDVTSLREVNGPAAIRFDPLSIDSMTRALLTLGEMAPSERVERIAQGKQWAAQYRWENVADQCEKVYREVARG